MKTASVGRGRSRLVTLGLGLAQMAATRVVSKAVQNERRRGVMRIFGSREIESGLGMLSRTRRMPWNWAKIAGDVMSLFTIGSAFAGSKRRRGRLGAVLAAVAGITALDIIYGRRMGKSH